jgi:hypothetical protein
VEGGGCRRGTTGFFSVDFLRGGSDAAPEVEEEETDSANAWEEEEEGAYAAGAARTFCCVGVGAGFLLLMVPLIKPS